MKYVEWLVVYISDVVKASTFEAKARPRPNKIFRGQDQGQSLPNFSEAKARPRPTALEAKARPQGQI